MKSAPDREVVILFEPQCWGFEHAACNAALVRTVGLAYPSAEIVFHGESTHLQCVRDELGTTHDTDGIRFRPVSIPARESRGWRRLPLEFAPCKRILAEARRSSAKAVIFTSIADTSLLALKVLMGCGVCRVATLAIPHSCLSSILHRGRRPWNWPIELKQVLALPHPHSLQLIALSESIRANMNLPARRMEHWSVLPLPYLWPSDIDRTDDKPPSVVGPPRFAFVGVGGENKGFNAFYRLADEVAPAPETARFIVAGFYPGPPEKRPTSQYVSDGPDEPLPRREFEALLRRATYVVSTAKPEHYRLTLSATFLDALAFLKPGVYLRNDYVEYYFDRMGDIGYLCNSHEEMVQTIRRIISEFPSIRYRRQVENIRKGRVTFEPAKLAPRLRHIVAHRAV